MIFLAHPRPTWPTLKLSAKTPSASYRQNCTGTRNRNQRNSPPFCMMEKYNGSILISNVLAFGIITLCFVVLRLSFRLHTRKTSASDWVLVLALISSLCQDAFNVACVTHWGYGHHKYDIPLPIRSSPEPLKVSKQVISQSHPEHTEQPSINAPILIAPPLLPFSPSSSSGSTKSSSNSPPSPPNYPSASSTPTSSPALPPPSSASPAAPPTPSSPS